EGDRGAARRTVAGASDAREAGAGAFDNGVRRRTQFCRPRNSPFSVLILISSPTPMCGGTLTLRPVSTTASFFTLVAVLPRTACSASITLSVTLEGSSTPTATVPWNVTTTG